MKKELRYNLAERIIDKKDIAALIKWLATDPRLTKGPLTVTFETAWARWVGTRYAVFCNSGSSANLLMAAAMLESGMLRNKKVIVPSVGWVTTIAPFMQLGFDPLMCGADPDNFGLDLAHLEQLLKQHRPALVVLVQELGVPSDMDALKKLLKRYDCILLEDACAAVGAEYGGKKVGSFGLLGTFSLFFGHQLSTIEGGMVVTDNKQLYDLLLMLRSHGWAKDLEVSARKRLMKTHKISDWHEPFTFFVPGYNLRSTDLQARIGLEQMKKADHVIAIRKRNHQAYLRLLTSVRLPRAPAKADPCSISMGVLAHTPAHRAAIIRALDAHGIETRLFSAGNLGLHPFWFRRYGKFHHPVSDLIHACGFFLPNHESLTLADVRFICRIVNTV